MDDDRARAATPGPVRAAELIRVQLPLVRPFRTARSMTTAKDALLVRLVTDDADGWGECTAEDQDGAWRALRDELLPRVLGGAAVDDLSHQPFAKTALEAAQLDASLRASNSSLASYLGGVRSHVDAGVAIGMTDDERELSALAAAYVAEGYRRIKLKIAPESDVGVVSAVRTEVGDAITLAADANGSFTLDDAPALARLDSFALQCIEQPLPRDALDDHAALARSIRTRICLDESITDARVASRAIAARACRIVNIKPGRVGGITEARRVHDVCVAAGVPALVGGMLETGIGRALNVALASLPGFTETGDLSASDRYFAEDLTEPFILERGRIGVPGGPGIGVRPRADMLRKFTVAAESFRAQNHLRF